MGLDPGHDDVAIVPLVEPQASVQREDRGYRVDYLVRGATLRLVVELDGFQYHSDRNAFTYDRVRQNDLAALGYTILRFSYEAVRVDTARCVEQLQAVLRSDPLLAPTVVPVPAGRNARHGPQPGRGRRATASQRRCRRRSLTSPGPTSTAAPFGPARTKRSPH